MLTKLKHSSLDDKEYKKRVRPMQLELMRYQQAIFKTGKRVIVLVEGTDTAGKGGMIKRCVELMDPRGVRVYPIGAPTSRENSTHYLKRFWKKIPHSGQFIVLDRSWYGRVLVERVEHLTEKKHWFRAYREITDFERLLIDDDIILIKLFLSIDKKEQTKRLLSRLNDPKKCWKITPEDMASREHWDDYQEAFDDMIEMTNVEYSPWHVVPANCKKYARVSCMEHISDTLAKHIDLEKVQLFDPKFTAAAIKTLQQ